MLATALVERVRACAAPAAKRWLPPASPRRAGDARRPAERPREVSAVVSSDSLSAATDGAAAAPPPASPRAAVVSPAPAAAEPAASLWTVVARGARTACQAPAPQRICRTPPAATPPAAAPRARDDAAPSRPSGGYDFAINLRFGRFAPNFSVCVGAEGRSAGAAFSDAVASGGFDEDSLYW